MYNLAKLQPKAELLWAKASWFRALEPPIKVA